MNINKFFTVEQKQNIIQAIQEAERQTSGEIRVHLESKCKGDALSRAMTVFQKLKMHETQLRNGTLIYIAVNDQKFAIYGDEGINEVIPDNFWQDVKEDMHRLFVKGRFDDGIISGIEKIGKKLKGLFPFQEDDINELPDDISIGE